MQRSRCRGTRRGASAPEYAIGAGLLALLLIGGMQALEGAAADRYDDQQAVVGTPVTDLGASTTATTASTGTTATIPSTTTTTTVATTTSTTAGPATTTTTAAVTTTTIPTLTLSATGVRGSGTNWSINFTVTSSRPTGTVTVRSVTANQSGTCVLSGGTCSGTIGGLKNQDGAQTATATAVGFATSNSVAVPVPS